MDVILEEYFKFIQKNPAMIVLVICGKLGDIVGKLQIQAPHQQPCYNLELLREEDNDVDVIAREFFCLQSCVCLSEDDDGNTTDNEFVENAVVHIYACERDVKRILGDMLS